MNKRAAILHWIVFGMFGALGLFLVLTSKVAIPQHAIGSWSTQLLYQGYFPVELDAVDLQAEITREGLQAVFEIAQRGGFAGFSPWGDVEGFQLLNRGEEWPDPQTEEGLVRLLQEKMSGREGLSLQSSNGLITGSLLQREDLEKGQYYQQINSVFFDAREFLEASSTIHGQALSLVEKCRDQKTLSSCLKPLPERWHYRSCKVEQAIPEPLDSRTLPFCVEWKGFPFEFALDFTATKLSDIKDIHVVDQQTTFELFFPQDVLAESYKLYLTDQQLGTGAVQDVDDAILEGIHVWSVYEFSPRKECPEEKLPGTAYACGETITYVLDKSTLPDKEQLFVAVTAVQGTKETEIVGWVEI